MKKPYPLKVGIVGCGAIGTSLALAIARDFKGDFLLAALYDQDLSQAQRLAAKFPRILGLNLNTLKCLVAKSDLVIEAASSSGAWKIAKTTLGQGKDILIMSVGGIAPHFLELKKLARSKGARVYIPSGAISGIDALKASGAGKIKKVELITRKHPRSFANVEYVRRKKIDLSGIRKDTVIFSGAAQDAIRFFPQNINVAALLSLAGIGLKATRVKIIASPAVGNNIHEVRFTSSAGRVTTCTENVLHPANPKTSYLAVLAAMACLRQMVDPVRVGT